MFDMIPFCVLAVHAALGFDSLVFQLDHREVTYCISIKSLSSRNFAQIRCFILDRKKPLYPPRIGHSPKKEI